MKAISREGQHSTGNRFMAAPLCHTLKLRRAKNSPANGRMFGSDFAGEAPLQKQMAISDGYSNMVEERELDSANDATVEQVHESLAEAGAILPVQKDAFEEIRPCMENVLLDDGSFSGVLPLEHSLVMAYVSSCRQGNRMVYVTPQTDYLGFPVEAWLGQTDMRLQQAHEDDFERLVDAIQHSYSTGEKFNCHYRLYDSNRKVHWFHDEARVVCDESGAPLLAQGVMLDITDKKEMEAELNEHRYGLDRYVEARTGQLTKRLELLESCNAALSGKLASTRREFAELKQQTAGHQATASTAQINNCVGQQDGISEWAYRVIELTRDNWIKQGCYRPRKNRHVAKAAQPAQASRPGESISQLDGISEWARNMIGWRVSAAGEIA